MRGDKVKKTTRKHWTGEPMQKGQVFKGDIEVKKVKDEQPTVVTINNCDFVYRPK